MTALSWVRQVYQRITHLVCEDLCVRSASFDGLIAVDVLVDELLRTFRAPRANCDDLVRDVRRPAPVEVRRVMLANSDAPYDLARHVRLRIYQ